VFWGERVGARALYFTAMLPVDDKEEADLQTVVAPGLICRYRSILDSPMSRSGDLWAKQEDQLEIWPPPWRSGRRDRLLPPAWRLPGSRGSLRWLGRGSRAGSLE
jgi:hypothetical protein